MYWQKVRKALADRPAQDMSLGAGATLTFLVRFGTYGLVAVAGIVVARTLGPHDRGVYSLVTTIALLYAAFSELGVSQAGIYFAGQKRYSLQEITSNNLGWLLVAGSIWIVASLTLAIVRPPFVPDDLRTVHFVIFALGGVLIQLEAMAQNMLVSDGSVLGLNAINFSEPFLRAAFIMGGVLLLGVGMVGVLSGWLLAIALTSLLAVYLVGRRVRPIPRIRLGILKQQLAYGLKSSFGFMLQVANHRFDVFIVAAFSGQAALGYYAVAFGMSELLWQIPFALGVIFFPKVSALDADTNTEVAVTTCRRALFIIAFGVLALLACGRFMIEFLYGSAFSSSVVAFYILAPSALFYTVHRVLTGALAGRGMPEASLYGGLISVPITLGLDFALIPRMGIEGAAIASTVAYAVNATVILFIFLRVTKRRITDVLLINRSDIEFSLQTARGFLSRSEPEPVGADG